MANGLSEIGNLLLPFDPLGSGYDINTANLRGLGPDIPSVEPHHGSLAPLSKEEAKKLGLPEGSGLLLKGTGHETFPLTLAEERRLGNTIIFKDGRYYSVPGRTSIPHKVDTMANGDIGDLLLPQGAPDTLLNPFPTSPGGVGVASDPNQPTDPARVSKWRQFLQRLRADPALQQTMLLVGAGLLRTPKPGQGAGDVVAGAVGQGVEHLAGSRALEARGRDVRAEREQRRDIATERETTTRTLAGLEARQREDLAQRAEGTAERREAAEQRRHEETISRADQQHKERMAALTASMNLKEPTDYDIVNKATKGLMEFYQKQNETAEINRQPAPWTQRNMDVHSAATGNRALRQSNRQPHYLPFTRGEVDEMAKLAGTDPRQFQIDMAFLRDAFGPTYEAAVSERAQRLPKEAPATRGQLPAPRSAAEAEERARGQIGQEQVQREAQTKQADIDRQLQRAEALGVSPQEALLTASNILDSPHASEDQRRRALRVLTRARRQEPSTQVPET